MVKEFNIYDAIQGTFMGFYNVARLGLKKNWKKLTAVERARAGRSLVLLQDLAKRPAKYFSRANTGAAWVKRAHDYADTHNMKDVYHAYMIVASPVDIVCEQARAALVHSTEDVKKLFYHFCVDVQNWEYGRTSEKDKEVYMAEVIEKSIVDKSRRLMALRKAIEPSKAQQWVQNKIKSLSK